MNKCKEHTTNQQRGKPCIYIIAEGKCLGKKCRLFSKVLRMLPKLKRLYELEVQGVDVTTVWDFSENGIKMREKRKQKAEKWLNELYPNIEKNITLLLSSG